MTLSAHPALGAAAFPFQTRYPDALIRAQTCENTEDADDSDGGAREGGDNGISWCGSAAAGDDDGLFVSMDRPTPRARLTRLRLRRWSRSSAASALSTASNATTVTPVPAIITPVVPAAMPIPRGLPSISSSHPIASAGPAPEILTKRRYPVLEPLYSDSQIRQTTATVYRAVENRLQTFETKHSGSVATSKDCNLSGKSSTLSSSSSATKTQKSFFKRLRQFASMFEFRSKNQQSPQRQCGSNFNFRKKDYSSSSPRSMASSLSSDIPPSNDDVVSAETQVQFLRSLPSLDLSASNMAARGTLDCRRGEQPPKLRSSNTVHSGMASDERKIRTLRRANTLGAKQNISSEEISAEGSSILEDMQPILFMDVSPTSLKPSPALSMRPAASMRARFQIQMLPRS
ncbi:hypothetical protein HDU82_002240 [Entophlyctis luteolus]|nr:hypothetical protein HDU82_002240 [Entophlyctis luteolus]